MFGFKSHTSYFGHDRVGGLRAATKARRLGRGATVLALSIVAIVLALIPAQAGAFGVATFSVSPSTTQAGAHPDVDILIERSGKPSEDIKDIYVDFPAGFLGNPEAASPMCADPDFLSDTCPVSSVIGTFQVTFTGGGARINTPGTVYMLEPGPGDAASVGFIARPAGSRTLYFKNNQKNAVAIRTDGDYGVSNSVLGLPDHLEPVDSSRLKPITIDTISIHLFSRVNGDPGRGYFMVNPTRCDNGAPFQVKLVDYLGKVAQATTGFTPTGCLDVPLEATTSMSTTPSIAGNAGAPTFTINMPTADAPIQNSHLRSATVTLPDTTGLNFPEIGAVPALCSVTELSADACSAGSRIGSISADVPFLPPAFAGDIYLISKGSQVRFGFVLRGPRGVKAAVHGNASTVDTDGDGADDTVVSRFINLPEFPWARATLVFERPLLINPTICNGVVGSDLVGYSGARKIVTSTLVTTQCGGPSLTVTSPTEGQVVGSTTVGVNFVTGPDLNGNPATSITCQLDAGPTDLACLSPKTYTGLGQGAHRVTVVASNADGRTSVARNFTVDTVPPTLTVTSPAAGAVLTSTSVSVSFTVGSDAASVTCALDASSVTDCVSPKIYEPVSDGAHSVTVVARDAVGNAATVVRAFTVDAPPFLQIDSPVDGAVVNSSTVVVNFTVSGQTSVSCALDGGAADTACVSPKTYAGVANGTHTVTIIARDAGGNTTTASRTFSVSSGLAVSITSPTEGQVLNSSTVNVGFTVLGATAVTCQLDTGAVTSGCVSPKSYTGVADGSHKVTIIATDAAGASATAIRNFKVDTVAPLVAISTPTEGQLLNVGVVSVTFTVSDTNLSTVSCKLDAGVASACTSPRSYTGLSDGLHTVTVVAVDSAGNTGSAARTFTVDTTPPTVIISSPTDGQVIGSSAVDVVFSVSGATSVTCELRRGSSVISLATACASPKTYTGLIDGEHFATVGATDAAGNSAAVTRRFLIDITPPSVSITAPAEGAVLGSGTVSVGFTLGADAVSAGCQLDAGVVDTACVPPKTYTGVADGAHTVKVTATDAANNVGTAIVGFTVDTTPPTLVITSPTEGAVLSSSTVDVVFSAGADAVSTTCQLDSGPVDASCISPKTFTGVAGGSHSVEVVARDAAGNANTQVRNFSVSTGPTASFKVTLAITTSTTQAAAHPSITGTVDISPGSSDLKAASIKLPNGLWGSLASVVAPCPIANATAGTCDPGTKIGTVYIEGTTASGPETANGDLFLTDGPTAANPGGVAVKVVHPTLGIAIAVGSVDVAPNTGSNMFLNFSNVPNVIGTTPAHMTKVRMTFNQVVAATGRSLLTNPSSCLAGSFTSSFTSYSGETSAPPAVAYTATGCSTVPFNPVLDLRFTNPTAGQVTGVIANVSLPTDNSTIRAVTARMPQSIGANFPAFGASSDLCPGTNDRVGTFSTAACPLSANVGTMHVTTPLLPTPVNGTVWLINKTPLPWLGVELIYPGVNIKLVGVTSTPLVDPLCDPSIDFCQTQVAATFGTTTAGFVPDVPVTGVVLDLSKTDRAPLGDGSLPGQILVVASPGECLPTDLSSKWTMTPHTANPAATGSQSFSFTGC